MKIERMIKQLWFLILLIAVLFSCKPRIKNDSETLKKVFSMSDFNIEILNQGCLTGTSIDYFSVKKKDNGFILKSNKTSRSHFVSQINMDSLKNYLKTKIGKEVSGGCTSSEYIRIGTLFNSVDYEHRHCSGIEATIINDLLNYYELIYETETSEVENEKLK